MVYTFLIRVTEFLKIHKSRNFLCIFVYTFIEELHLVKLASSERL